MKQIQHKTKNYFEGVIYGLGWGFGLIALGLILTKWYLTPLLGYLAYLIITAHYKLTIYPETREIEDYLLISGIKTQHEKFRYSSIQHIYITQSSYTQQMNYKSISSSVAGKIYNAYLLTDVANIYLGESKDLDKLKTKIRPLAEQLELEIVDP